MFEVMLRSEIVQGFLLSYKEGRRPDSSKADLDGQPGEAEKNSGAGGSTGTFNERDEGKHGEFVHVRLQLLFEAFPGVVRKHGHEAAHADTAGDEIAERHEGLDLFDAEKRKFLVELETIALKENPRESAIGSGKWAGGRESPIGSFGVDGFVMKVFVDEVGPGSDPGLDHQDPSTGTEAARSFAEEGANVREMVEDIGHDDGAKGFC